MYFNSEFIYFDGKRELVDLNRLAKEEMNATVTMGDIELKHKMRMMPKMK